MSLEIVDHEGMSLMSRRFEARATGTRPYDLNALHNGFAREIKEFLTEFLNKNEQEFTANTSELDAAVGMDAALFATMFPDLDPDSAGTGFFINDSGASLTAAHVVEECIAIELHHKGRAFPAKITFSSLLLDMAVVEVDYKNSHWAVMNEATDPSLGQQVFVTGYPLADLLVESASITMGNVSSLGGLKGSEGYFQFTAPVQPGNSGGPITDFEGNVIGVVSATLNQAMMLEATQTVSQNLNFGIETPMVLRFIENSGTDFEQSNADLDFEQSSAAAVEYTNQIFCFE